MKTICLGPQGSFSEEALLRICATQSIEVGNIQYVESNSLVISTLLSSRDPIIALSAMHTLAEGRVEESFGSIACLPDFSPGLEVFMALKMPINFCLLAKNISIHEVEGVLGHEKARVPCSDFLRDIEFKAVKSNSEAARLVAQDDAYKKWASLAPLLCSKIYELDILLYSVSDSPAITTFYAFARGLNIQKAESDEWRVLSVFDLPHEPKALGELLKHIDYNILHINSIYRSEGKYRFILEVEVKNSVEADLCADKIRKHTLSTSVFVFPVLSM